MTDIRQQNNKMGITSSRELIEAFVATLPGRHSLQCHGFCIGFSWEVA
jgi:hypothetical protein